MKNNRKIVVISGASSGIGLATVEQLGKRGNLVFAGARKENDIANLTSIENVHGVKLDITHPEWAFPDGGRSRGYQRRP